MFRRTTTAARVLRLIAVIVLALLTIEIGEAQSPDTPIDATTVNTLLQRVQALQDDIAALKAQVNDLKSPKSAADSQAPVKIDATMVHDALNQTSLNQTSLNQTSMDTMSPPAKDSSVQAITQPRLHFRGYGDVGWNVSDEKNSTNSFALGELNLFLTSRLTDNVSFLAETVISADQSTNEFSIEPERLMLLYHASDWLNLSVGRYHTTIGYYNNAYHHSALMQTTLARPFLFAFEDDGGILPVHSVGISATGTVSSKFGLHYVADIGNGRSSRRDFPVQNVTDDNNGKAFNLGFFVRPPLLSGSQLGFSVYHDHVTPSGGINTAENIFAAHMVYLNSRFEFLNEAVLMRHALDQSQITINTPGFYSQISRRFGAYRPYLRYEYLNVPQRDPLYSDVGLLHGPKLGIRYDLSEFSAFKVEYGRNMRRGLDATNTLGTQLSFEF